MLKMYFLLPLFFLTGSLFLSGQSADSAAHYLQKGLQQKQGGSRLESLRFFEKAYSYDSTSREIVSELALAYQDLRKYGNALQTYKKLAAMGASGADVYDRLVQLCYQMRQYDDLFVYAAKLKEMDPQAKISYYIGKAHYENENYGEAIKNLQAAAKEDPRNAEIPYLVARSYADMMNYKQAVPLFKKALELDSTKTYWMYELGLIYYAMHDDKNALKYILDAGTRGMKRDAEYLENLAIAYLNVGQLDSGVTMLNEILKKRPSDMNVLNMIAEAYYYKGKFDQAIEYWDRILEYDKENASALYMIGMSYQKKGGKSNTEKGIALCDKAIEMDPSLASLKQKKMSMGL